MNPKSSLNPVQRQAVEIESGPVLVLAGAGSGKTRVIAHRIVHLISKLEVPATGIVALTFTNKVADEMKTRISQHVGKKLSKGLVIGTFHSLCSRILRNEIHHLGRKHSFIIYDSSEQLGLIRNILRDMNFNNEKYDPRIIISMISQAKNSFRTPFTYTQPFDDGYEFVIKKVFDKYESLLKRYNALDFDDLLVYATTLFNQYPGCLNKYQQKFQHVLVDEYQDTNELQYLLIKQLARSHRNIFVVGDDDQSIYGWRGAQPENLHRFKKDFAPVKLITLDQNYRSTNNILRVANAVISKNKRIVQKNLWSKKSNGEKIQVLECEDEINEAETIVEDIIQKKILGKTSLSQFAIFFRTNYQSRILEETLRMRRVPYALLCGLKFYDRKEVKDLLAYCKLLVNHSDDNSLLRIINYPRRNIGNTTVERVDAYATSKNISLYKAVSSIYTIPEIKGKVENRIKEFVELIDKYGKLVQKSRFTPVIRAMIDEIGLRDELHKECKNSTEFGYRWDNIQEILNSMDYFETVEKNGLKSYLDRVALFNDADNDRAGKLEKSDSVKLITLHGAKGLEFSHVYIVGLEEDILPHLKSAEEDNSVQEERRLFYVGITRACETLTISHARTRRKYGKQHARIPSRFLAEIPSEYIRRNDEEELLTDEDKKKIGMEYLSRIKELFE